MQVEVAKFLLISLRVRGRMDAPTRAHMEF
jgi:hypothetical protein